MSKTKKRRGIKHKSTELHRLRNYAASEAEMLKRGGCEYPGCEWTVANGKFVPCVYDWDHKPDQRKFKNVSTMITDHAAPHKVLEEIAKCNCYCKNHHAIVTNARFDEEKVEKAEERLPLFEYMGWE